MVSTRRRVPTNWVSGRTLQPFIESVVANSFVPSDFLVDGQVSGLGTVHPLFTINFFSTWILPLHVVISTLKRKSPPSIMDGLQKKKNLLSKCHQIGISTQFTSANPYIVMSVIYQMLFKLLIYFLFYFMIA